MTTAPQQRKRIMIVAGTRPEAIKMAPVIKALKTRPDVLEPFFVTTAQHRQILDQVLSLFNITPDVDLNIMSYGQNLAQLTSRVLEKMTRTLKDHRPDMVLVQGDTTTVLASAMAAFYQKVPVAHIEAGLRSHDPGSPFPEEINRRLTTAMADFHFAPTEKAKNELLKEGVQSEKIRVTGNTVVDALLHILGLPFNFEKSPLGKIAFGGKRLILLTCHRRESWGQPLINIYEAVKTLIKHHDDILVVYPVHPNPIVKNAAESILSKTDRVHLVEPLDYLTFVNLMKRASIIMTDSGGLQEEAPTLKKPLLLLRNVTERPEAFEAGLAEVVGTCPKRIVLHASNILNDSRLYHRMTTGKNPYGDGFASRRILDVFLQWTDKNCSKKKLESLSSLAA